MEPPAQFAIGIGKEIAAYGRTIFDILIDANHNENNRDRVPYDEIVCNVSKLVDETRRRCNGG